MPTDRDPEKNRLTARAKRYARVGVNVGGVAARVAAKKALGRKPDHGRDAFDLASALGGLKGPIMKVAQLLATIPDAVPAEYANELMKLQSQAPPMGWHFVRRRMAAELGADWQAKFRSFEHEPAAAASLGQVHRAVALTGEALACKLQYPDMQSAVEADLQQLSWLLSLRRRFDGAIDTSQIAEEIGERLREELDYRREAKHVALYRAMLKDEPRVRVPQAWPDLSTGRLLTLDWLDGRKLLAHKDDPLAVRNCLAEAMFMAWWLPFRQVDLYHGLERGDDDLIVHAYETWGFRNLSRDLIDVLNIWAKFIYGPLLDNRTRTIADGVKPSDYGRREAFRVHQALKQKGPVTVPREFVFMDRAAIGLGAVFLHLAAELNFYEMFNAMIERFDVKQVAARQQAALRQAGLLPPAPARARR